MAKTIKEMIEVMEWFDNGGEVELKRRFENDTEWRKLLGIPTWNWDDFDYRIRHSKPKITIEKWLVEENNIKVVVEASDIDSWLKPLPTVQKLKLIESYEVEI